MTDPHRDQNPSARQEPWSQPVQGAPYAAPTHSSDGSGTGQQAKDSARHVADDSKNAARHVADDSKNAARHVADDAKQAGRAVADTAKVEAAGVKDDAVREGRKLWDETTSTLGTQASDQLNRAAGTVRTFTDDLGRMSRGEKPEQGLASDLTSQLSERGDALAGWLETHEPADMLTEVTSFARRRPLTFLAIAAGVGFAAGRLTRSVAQVHRDDSDGNDYAGAGHYGAPGGQYQAVPAVPPPPVDPAPGAPVAGTPGYPAPPVPPTDPSRPAAPRLPDTDPRGELR